jgi:hypothetical protein
MFAHLAQSLQLDGRDSIPGRGKRFWSSPQRLDGLCPIHPATRWAAGGSFLGEKTPRHEADHSLQSSSEVGYSGAILHFPILLHNVGTDFPSTGTNFPYTYKAKQMQILTVFAAVRMAGQRQLKHNYRNLSNRDEYLYENTGSFQQYNYTSFQC